MADAKKTQLKTYRVLAKIEVESWHDIKAESFEQAGKIAETLKPTAFVEALEELYDFGPVRISSISFD